VGGSSSGGRNFIFLRLRRINIAKRLWLFRLILLRKLLGLMSGMPWIQW
jgi:hypothetical protein